jgi:hypothetical protein
VKRTLAVAALAATLLALLPSPAPARPRTPVVMLVLDELPLVSLLDRRGRIDPVRYPNFAALARMSTWYPNATTVSDATRLAVPSILTGRTPGRLQPATTRGHPRNLFTLLQRQGYRLSVEEEATSLCPYRGCRRRFGARAYLARDRLERVRHFIAGLGSKGISRALYYKHSLLPHVPWLFLPSTRRYNQTVRGPVPGLNSSEISVFDPTLVRQSWQRHLLQVGAVDTLIGEMLARMRETGLLGRAVLVVAADHGIAFRVGATDRRTIVPVNSGDVAPVPLFIRVPGQRRGRVDRSLIRTYDVLPTIARRIGLRLPRGLHGRPAGSRAVRRRGRVRVLSRAPIRHVSMSRRRLAQLRSRALRRKLRLFGSGRRSVFDFGPNRSLLLKNVTEVRVAGPRGRVRARLDDADAYTSVNPAAGYVPVHVTGTITGGRRGARRNIAVALNGYIRGVGRTARLRGRSREIFSVILPESALVKGRNPVEIFTVERRRGTRLLRRIYGRPYQP